MTPGAQPVEKGVANRLRGCCEGVGPAECRIHRPFICT